MMVHLCDYMMESRSRVVSNTSLISCANGAAVMRLCCSHEK